MKNLYHLFLLATLSITVQSVQAQTMRAEDNSLNSGKVEWLPRQISAGTVPFGQPVSREFEVKNISTESLMILQVKSSCHCTVAQWSNEPVKPGATTHITVTYDGLREGDFYRIVTVLTNFDTNQPVPLALTGKVEAKAEVRSK